GGRQQQAYAHKQTTYSPRRGGIQSFHHRDVSTLKILFQRQFNVALNPTSHTLRQGPVDQRIVVCHAGHSTVVQSQVLSCFNFHYRTLRRLNQRGDRATTAHDTS